MKIPHIHIPIVRIPYSPQVELYIKREDLIHPEISGNKYWKLFYNIQAYIAENKATPMLITFGGAYSNHIAAVAALGRDLGLPTAGIIRGEEVADLWADNPTLSKAHNDGMELCFVSRTEYRDKEKLSRGFAERFPDALILPEGGTNPLAVKGIQHMLDRRTKDFDYLCSAVGTGGTVAGLATYAEEGQKVLGFKVVNDPDTETRILSFTGRKNFTLKEAWGRGYGKITDELLRYTESFEEQYGVPLDPIYTGKMMMHLTALIDRGYFPVGSRILAFHTGGLQGKAGIEAMLQKKKKSLINLP